MPTTWYSFPLITVLVRMAILLVALRMGGAAEDWFALQTPQTLRGDPRAMASDEIGNRYVLGGFMDGGDFHPLPGALDVNTNVNSFSDICVTRINADGSYAWTQAIGGSGWEGWALDSAEGSFGGIVAMNGTVYVWFSFGSTDLMIGEAGPWSHVNGNGFIAALDAATGAVESDFGDGGVVQIVAAESIFPRAVTALEGVIYVTGHFDSADLGIGALGSRPAPPAAVTFIAAIDASSGAPLASFGDAGLQTIEGVGGSDPWAIAAHTSGVYVAGMFAGDDLGIGGAGAFEASGSVDIFVAALNRNDGTALTGFGSSGLQRLGGIGMDQFRALAVTDEGIYVGGSFNGDDFGIGGFGTLAAVEVDGFVAALDRATGAPLSGFGNEGLVRITGSGWEHIQGVAVDQGFLVVAGSFIGTSDLGISGPGSGQSLGSNLNAFVAVLSSSTGAAHLSFGGDGLITLVSANGPRVRAVMTQNGVISLLLRPVWTDVLVEGWDRIRIGTDTVARGLLLRWQASNGEPLLGQELTMAPIAPRIIGDAAFVPAVTPDPTSGNPVTLHSTDPTVATVAGMTVTVQGIGSCDIIAVQAAGNGRPMVAVGRMLTVIADSVATDPQVQTRPIDAMTVDPHGSRYLVTRFMGDHDPRSGHGAVLTGHELYWNLAVTRLHGDGSHVWSQSITGIAKEGLFPGAIAVSNGVVYLLGSAGPEDLAVGPPGATPPWTIGGIDAFVAALDASTGAPVNSFGRNGIQRIGGNTYPNFEWGTDLVVTSTGVYVVGYHRSVNLGIGAVGTFATQGPAGEVFVAALHPQTGAALSGFGSGGLQRITGSEAVTATGITAAQGVLYITGRYAGTALGIGALGTMDADGAGLGFVAAIDATSGQPVTGFGTGGLLPLRSTVSAGLQAAAVDGETLYLIGHGAGTFTLGDGGPGIELPVGPGLLMAVQRATGQPRVGFGSGGMVGFGSDSFTAGRDVVALGGKVIFTGGFEGDTFGVGAPGTVSSPGGERVAMIVVVNGATGVPDLGFSGDGIELIGPGDGIAVARSNRRVFAAGFLSGLAGIGGSGSWDATTGWSSYVVAVEPQGASTGSGTVWPGTGLEVTGGSSGCGAGGSAFAFVLIILCAMCCSTRFTRFTTVAKLHAQEPIYQHIKRG